jgi:hypothetical protein
MATQQAISNPAASPARNVRSITGAYTVTGIDHDAILVMNANTTLSLGTAASCAGTKVHILNGLMSDTFTIKDVNKATVPIFTWDAGEDPPDLFHSSFRTNSGADYDHNNAWGHFVLFCNGENWFLSGYAAEANA